MSKGEVLIYQGKDGFTQVSVRVEEGSVWLNQNQLADLFQTTKQNIGQHIKNILAEGELEAEGTVKDFFTVAREGQRNVFAVPGINAADRAPAHSFPSSSISPLRRFSRTRQSAVRAATRSWPPSFRTRRSSLVAST